MNKFFFPALGTALALGLTACSGAASQSTANSSTGSAAQSTAAAAAVSTADSSYTRYTYPDAAYDTDETGAEALALSGETTTIGKAGTYLVTGSITGGQLVIDVDKSETVHLILDGVSITSSDGPAIWAKHGTLIVTLRAGSENTLADSGSYSMAEEEDAPTAALFSKDDLYLNGTGSLTVAGSYNDAISSKDVLVVTGGSYKLDAVDDGLVGHDGLAIADGALTVVAGGDGAKSSGADEGQGWLQLDGGSLTITAGDNALQAELAMMVSGGTLNGSAVQDGLHANGSIWVEGGSLSLSVQDDGIHADDLLLVSGGEVSILQSYEGLEASDLQISGGTIQVTASDDGLNAAGGSDGETGSDFFARSTGVLTISGGTLTVDAGGDGLDSNGPITMTGGTVVVYGPTDGGNGALDYDSTFEISGGTLAALGYATMAQSTSSSSAQASLMVTYNAVQQADTLLTLTDESGSTLYTVTAAKSFNNIVLSLPELAQGSAYTLTCGSTATTVTLDSAAVSVDQDGNAVQAGMGGMMGGGMGGHGGMGGGQRGGMTAPDGTEASPDGTDGSQPTLPEDGGERPQGDLTQGERPQRGQAQDGTAPGDPANGERTLPEDLPGDGTAA